jgi:5-methylcytosine-specific restriction endonuclease McrA
MKLSFELTVALAQIRSVLWRVQHRTCALCGHPLRSPFSVTIEHVVPRSRGGLWGFGNVVGAHVTCNHRKADRMPTGCELIWLLAVNARLGVQPQGW